MKDTSDGDRYYFTFSPHPRFKFLALDPYDISICGRKSGDPENKLATEILSKNNTNSNWNNPMGLKNRYFVKFNGGVGQEQLQWLNKELELAEEAGQKVVIMSHIPIHPGCTSDICLPWNYEEVLDIIHKYSCVKICFHGHNHYGKSCVDGSGVHHIAFPAVLECEPGQNAFATAYVFDDVIKIKGYGIINSYSIDI